MPAVLPKPEWTIHLYIKGNDNPLPPKPIAQRNPDPTNILWLPEGYAGDPEEQYQRNMEYLESLGHRVPENSESCTDET